MTKITKAVDDIIDILEPFNGEDTRSILNILNFQIDLLEEEEE